MACKHWPNQAYTDHSKDKETNIKQLFIFLYVVQLCFSFQKIFSNIFCNCYLNRNKQLKSVLRWIHVFANKQESLAEKLINNINIFTRLSARCLSWFDLCWDRSEEQFNSAPVRQSGPHVFCRTKTSNFHKTFLSQK